MKNIFLRR